MKLGEAIIDKLDKALKDPTNHTVVMIVRARKLAGEIVVTSFLCLVEGYYEFEETEKKANSQEAFDKRQRILDVIMDEHGNFKDEHWLHPLTAHKLLKAGAGFYAITLVAKPISHEEN